jgi:hypothetical protein
MEMSGRGAVVTVLRLGIQRGWQPIGLTRLAATRRTAICLTGRGRPFIIEL